MGLKRVKNKKNHIKFNYNALKPLDIVHCAGKSPMATLTRMVTAGFRQGHNYSIAVHTGILVEFHGQLLIAEMQNDGLRLNSLERYNTRYGKRWVIKISRMDIDNSAREAIQQRIAKDLRRTIEYDFRGLIEFINSKVDDDKVKNYCSEYVYEITKDFVDYPEHFAFKVSPFDLQTNSFRWEVIRYDRS